MGSSRVHASDYKIFCTLLKEWRTEAKMSQRQLASQLNQTQCYIWKCEAGERRIDPIEWIAWIEATGTPHKTAFSKVKELLTVQ